MTKRAFRPLRQDDLAAAADLIAAVDLFPSDLLAGMAAPFLAGEAEDGWLISDDQSAVAYFAPERMTDGTWNLLMLAVHPEQQGQGLGRAMVAEVEAALLAKDARLLLVETSGTGGFAGQRQFYRQLGFVEEARIRNYYQAGDDKIVFSKDLVG